MNKILLLLLFPLFLWSETSTIGSGGNYADLTTWEAAKDGLSQDDTGQLIDAADYDEADFEFDGKSASYTWTLVGSGSGVHDGTFGSGAYITNTGAGHVVTVNDQYVIMEDLEILLEAATAVTSNEGVRIGYNNATGLLTMRRCIIRFDVIGDNDCDGVFTSASCDLLMENCIVYNFTRAGIQIQTGGADVGFSIFNTTVDNCGESGEGLSSGICWYTSDATNETFVTKNTIVLRTTNGPGWREGSAAIAFTGDYNGTHDSDAGEMPGANSILNLVAADEVTTLGDDYHLPDALGAVYNTGIGPGSDGDIPTDDIDGETRSGATCDMGADEYTVAGPAPEPAARRRIVF